MECMDSPAVFPDSYVIILNDYDSNIAYVLKDMLDMGAIKLPPTRYRTSCLCGFIVLIITYFSNHLVHHLAV